MLSVALKFKLKSLYMWYMICDNEKSLPITWKGSFRIVGSLVNAETQMHRFLSSCGLRLEAVMVKMLSVIVLSQTRIHSYPILMDVDSLKSILALRLCEF